MQLDSCANLWKIQWQEKRTPNLRGKTLKMKETFMGQSREKNPLCGKIKAKYFPYLSFTHPKICSQSSKFYHSVLSLWTLIFSLTHSPWYDTHNSFITFIHNPLWLEFSVSTNDPQKPIIYRKFFKAEDGLNWLKYR